MTTSPQNSRPDDIARKRAILRIICIGLIVSALTIALLPMPVPLPLRLGVAFIDLVAAAAIWLIGRQKLSGK